MGMSMNTFFARLTWNRSQWRQPSGPDGKGEQGTYVATNGFGHEEWLNRREWHIGGRRHGFVQGVHRARPRLEQQGERWINLIFYTISATGERVYAGELNNAEVLQEGQAAEAAIAFR